MASCSMTFGARLIGNTEMEGEVSKMTQYIVLWLVK